eukprot:7215777-Ditylum_brightwellii.AAC.1
MYNAIEKGVNKEKAGENALGNDFIKHAKEISTPIRRNVNKGNKRSVSEVFDLIGENKDLKLVCPMQLNTRKEERDKLRLKPDILPSDLLDLINKMEEVIKSLILFILTNESTQSEQEAVVNNINTCLTGLEAYVGGDQDELVGDGYPTVSITIKEMVDVMNEHVLQLEKEHQRAIEQGHNLKHTNLTIKNDKRSMLQALHALIECLKATEMLAMEAKVESNK